MDLTFTIVQIQKQSFDSFLKYNRALKSHVNVKVNINYRLFFKHNKTY